MRRTKGSSKINLINVVDWSDKRFGIDVIKRASDIKLRKMFEKGTVAQKFTQTSENSNSDTRMRVETMFEAHNILYWDVFGTMY